MDGWMGALVPVSLGGCLFVCLFVCLHFLFLLHDLWLLLLVVVKGLL